MDTRLQLRTNQGVLFLASLLILIVALAISQSGWTEGLDVIVWIALGSIVVGLIASRSLLPTLIAHIFSAIIGLGWSFWVITKLLPDYFTWRLKWEEVWDHIENWYILAQRGGVIHDNLMFIFQMGLIVWILGYLSIWFLFRSSKIWNAVVPGGIVLLINLYYAPENLTLWFIAYLLIALLLIVRFNLFEYESRWRLEHIHFRSDISFDFLRNGLVFSVIVITLAWFTPAVNESNAGTVFDRFDRQWRDVQEEWNRLFAGLNYKPQASSNPNAFAQTHALGGARRLSEAVVMFVEAEKGRYWRAVVFDGYDGNGWTSSDRQEVRFNSSGASASLPVFEARETITQTFTPVQEGLFVLYALNNPMQISRPTVAKTSFISPQETSTTANNWAGQASPWAHEMTYIESDARLKTGEQYEVISQLSNATRQQLREDSIDYPQWIRDRYLEIPETTPQRVKNLAVEITSRADTAYDKAEAIERYMRNNIVYNESISTPPRGRDKVDYILFDLQEAYCDYYATSMIVMLRSLGVPARFAAGYARGTRETLEDQRIVYQVKNVDAHSWVEVYFPSYGWIEFEPTAAQPVIVRQSEVTDFNPGFNEFEDMIDDVPFDPIERMEDADLMAGGDLGLPLTNFYIIPLPFFGDIQAPKVVVNWSLFGLVVLALGFAGWRTYHAYDQKDTSDNVVVGNVYFAMLKLAKWMGLGKHPAQTPHEHAHVLTENLPPVEEEVNYITDAFVRQEYSPRDVSQERRSKLLQTWDVVRPKLFRAIFSRRIPKIRLPFKW